jgi:hypothetical protein
VAVLGIRLRTTRRIRMFFGFQSVTDLSDPLHRLRDRPYGVIETAEERLVGVHLRPFPKFISWPEIALLGRWSHRRRRGNRCLLYYNQPCRHRNYLALKYVVSTAGATLQTFRLALTVLDQIARLKRSDALLCDVANPAISDRLLARWGWEPLRPAPWHRLHIKRFYGDYSDVEPAAGKAARLEPIEALSPV